jgi:hypothetical protein
MTVCCLTTTNKNSQIRMFAFGCNGIVYTRGMYRVYRVYGACCTFSCRVSKHFKTERKRKGKEKKQRSHSLSVRVPVAVAQLAGVFRTKKLEICISEDFPNRQN